MKTIADAKVALAELRSAGYNFIDKPPVRCNQVEKCRNVIVMSQREDFAFGICFYRGKPKQFICFTEKEVFFI
ncbi:hypothetical protein [Arundinibacter roseus]|uniref:Uncharacterized protein n=1 Tax=Arundinibacter roseus TaxID=2070510 RepID=A0A4R4KK96_9BACT|nr:hypothetical protein [Arundinibacter roseus]TDB67119.1 hypothetical protein EZE20_08375 [Arundinibacter roseus]